jgi:hypothetical protein
LTIFVLSSLILNVSQVDPPEEPNSQHPSNLELEWDEHKVDELDKGPEFAAIFESGY